MNLVHWTYTREEWRNFKASNAGKIKFVSRLIGKIMSVKPVPEIRITPDQVVIGERKHLFNDQNHQLKDVDIREEGPVNIIEITFERTANKSTMNIRVPVPKGKLREALEMRDRLMGKRR